MTKVNFKRIESVNDLDNIEKEDGNFIVTGDGHNYIDYGNNRVSIGGTPDTQMDDLSTNPIQNKVVKKYIDDKFTTNSTSIEKLKKSNIYSTNESVAGTYEDETGNEEIRYRKSYKFGSVSSKSSVSKELNIVNLNYVTNFFGSVNTDGTVRSCNATGIIPFIHIAENKIYLSNTSDDNITSAYITIEYTKTTDEVSE